MAAADVSAALAAAAAAATDAVAAAVPAADAAAIGGSPQFLRSSQANGLCNLLRCQPSVFVYMQDSFRCGRCGHNLVAELVVAALL